MILKIATATAVMAFAATSAAALEKVSFGTNWVPEAEHGGYYQAVADGTYQACGLDVTIVPGGPQVNNRALLMAGKLDFNMAGNLLPPFNAVLQGVPLVVVAADFQKDPQVILTHPGRVKNFADLATLPKLLIGNGGYSSFFQWMITDYGFKPERRVPYTYNSAPFIADPDAGQQGYVTSEPFAVKREGGFAPDIYLLADAGFSTYATLIETMQPMVDTRPEVVKCFVEGSAIGWANYLYGDPSAGNALIMKENPEMTSEQIAFSIAQLKKFGIVDSGTALKQGIGAMDPATIEDFYTKMVKAGVVDAGLDLSKVYTTKFSNTGVSLAVKKALTGQ